MTQAASSEKSHLGMHTPLPRVGSLAVVVALCRGELSWLPAYIAGLERMSGVAANIYIYSKCNVTATLPMGISATSLPNVGRNDHTFAHHIAGRYHSLEDVTFFIKDTLNPNHPQHRGFDDLFDSADVYRTAVLLGFACHYTAMEVAGHTHSVWHNMGTLRDFALIAYPPNIHPGVVDEDFIAHSRPYGRWLDSILDGVVDPPETLWPVCYGGNFAVTARNIRAVPHSLWNRAQQSLARGNNIEEGHYMERSWAGLLTRRLSQHDTDLLMNHRDESSICWGKKGIEDDRAMFWSLRCGDGHALYQCKC